VAAGGENSLGMPVSAMKARLKGPRELKPQSSAMAARQPGTLFAEAFGSPEKLRASPHTLDLRCLGAAIGP